MHVSIYSFILIPSHLHLVLDMFTYFNSHQPIKGVVYSKSLLIGDLHKDDLNGFKPNSGPDFHYSLLNYHQFHCLEG